jgi:hypothetical protein
VLSALNNLPHFPEDPELGPREKPFCKASRYDENKIILFLVNTLPLHVSWYERTNNLQKQWQGIYMHLWWLRQLLMEQSLLCLVFQNTLRLVLKHLSAGFTETAPRSAMNRKETVNEETTTISDDYCLVSHRHGRNVTDLSY